MRRNPTPAPTVDFIQKRLPVLGVVADGKLHADHGVGRGLAGLLDGLHVEILVHDKDSSDEKDASNDKIDNPKGRRGFLRPKRVDTDNGKDEAEETEVKIGIKKRRRH